MPTYKEMLSQIEELKILAERTRQTEIVEARNQIRQLMEANSIDIKDLLRDKNAAQVSKQRKPVEAKYRDPKSGTTWSGRGRAPKWMSGHDRQKLLIK